MDLSSEKQRGYVKRILLSRMRILCNNGFYGLLLMHMDFAIDMECKTASTDGRKIYFGPSFLNNLSDDELDFIMMHEIMHCALKHIIRTGNRDPEAFNIACDIVINSNILMSNKGNPKSITLSKYGESMHLTPKGDEGCNYTAEEVYEMLPSKGGKKKQKGSSGNGMSGNWDDHSRWGTAEDGDETLREEWTKHLLDAVEAISIRDPSKSFGGIPIFAQRLLKEIKKGQIDWREILNNFIQEEICDYSFTPPDRRFDDSPFFLPDYNEKDEKIGNIWFVIDTSGSISDDAIRTAYSEICNAIEQFNGKLSGILSFTESYVTDPVPFSNIDELLAIKPVGGGGNDFSDIFRYMQKNMMDDLPNQIIIITDGYDYFPPEKEALGVPVLWLINNDDESVDPPFGKVARIVVE
jgi:predicted metal-dependent peptidase